MTERLKAVRPGEILEKEFLEPLGINRRVFAEMTDLPLDVVERLITGSTIRVTDRLANCLARVLDTTPEFWLNLEQRYREEISSTAGGE